MAEEKKDGSSDGGDSGSKKEENLWTSFLSKQAGMSFQEGHLVVCGNPGSGKTSLVRFFGRMEGDSFGEMKKFLMMRYSYVMLDDGQALLNVMQVSHPSHLAVLSETVPIEHMDNIAYMIVLNSGAPAEVEAQWNLWIEAIEKQQNALLDRLSDDQKEALKDKS